MKLDAFSTLCIIAVLHISCGNPGEQTSQTANGTESGKLTIDSATIDYHRYGEGVMTLLFVHGWCINQTYWLNQIEAMRADYQVVTIDLPGFGQSKTTRKDFSIERYGKDIISVIEQLKLDNVILIGHSMSGDVILEAALKHPSVIALIGVDNFKEVGTVYTDDLKAQIANFVSSLRAKFQELAPAFAERALFHQSTDSLVRVRIINDISSCNPDIAVPSLANLFAYGEREDDQLSVLKQKLYLINSDATPTGTDGLTATGVSFEVIPINATGHYPMIEKPDEFNRLLKDVVGKIAIAYRTGN